MSKVWRQVSSGAICGVMLLASGCIIRERVIIFEVDNPYTRMAQSAASAPTTAPSAAPVAKREIAKKMPRIDCEQAVINVRGSIYDDKGKLLRQLGPVATGRWYQEEFAAVYFFNTVEEAFVCDPSEDVALWDNKAQKWKKVEGK